MRAVMDLVDRYEAHWATVGSQGRKVEQSQDKVCLKLVVDQTSFKAIGWWDLTGSCV